MLHGRTQMSSVCYNAPHTGCPVNFGSGLKCQCTCHLGWVDKSKKKPKTARVTAYFTKLAGGDLCFGLIGPDGKENWDMCIDMISLLADAKVRIDLEVEMPPTHGGTSKYGRALRMIKPKGKRK